MNYSLQVVNNINTNHMDIQEAMSWSNIDKKSFVVSTVGGFVGGLTLGATTMACGALGLTEGTTAVVESVIGGGLSNILSGQAQALTGSAIDQFVNHTSINEGMLYFKPNASEFLNDAEANGFLSADQIAYDGGVGAVLGTLGGFGKKIIADLGIPDPLYLSRQPNVLVRPATNAIDFLVEYGTQTTSRTKEQAR